MADTRNLKVTSASKAALAKAQELKLTVTSGYRSAAEDKRVGGTGTGYHVLGQALDVAGAKAAMDTFAKWAKASGKFRSVLWQVADHYDHVHVSWNYPEGAQGTADPEGGLVERGDKGGLVAAIQKLLGGLTADGIFGAKTEQAVKDFQTKHSLSSDGVVGKNTWNSLTSGGGLFFYK